MSDQRVSVLVPTRNRPGNVRRLIDSAHATSALPPEFIFYVDDDDPTCAQTIYIAHAAGASVITGPRIVLSEMWNRCAEKASHDVMMHCGDDIVFRSHNWDHIVTAFFAHHVDKLVLVHGDDGYQRANIATHGFYHRNWVETLGYLVPPYFSSDYNDLWLTEVADELGRRHYVPEVYTEHMHPSAGKGDIDQTHQERLARHERDDVAGLYVRLLPERRADVAKLRDAIESGRYRA